MGAQDAYHVQRLGTESCGFPWVPDRHDQRDELGLAHRAQACASFVVSGHGGSQPVACLG
jgi:hypothetical protein